MTGQWANGFDYTAAGYPLILANEYDQTKQHTEKKKNPMMTMLTMMMTMKIMMMTMMMMTMMMMKTMTMRMTMMIRKGQYDHVSSCATG